MNRRKALKKGLSLAALGLASAAGAKWGLSMLNGLFNAPKSDRMPVLFVGHGSPMNAIEDNAFSQTLDKLGKELPRPTAVLAISAHWMTTGGTLVAEAVRPQTIHDFGGFPKALFDVQYPAPGSPETAKLVQQSVTQPMIHGDEGEWGLDHGTWAVLKHLYPQADVPVLQLSIDMSQPPEYHLKIGEQLAVLRDRGVLILGSGNIVHNLRVIRFAPGAQGYEWAHEFDEWSKARLNERDHHALAVDYHKTEAGRLSIPTMDHYLPLMYILGASNRKDDLRHEFEDIQLGSCSMRTVSFGRS